MLELQKLGQEDLQLNNRWSCYFQGISKSDFMIKSISLPFEKLLTETKKYGDKKYTGFTPVENITITFFENTKFEIYEFFKDWMDDIFDPTTRTFRVLANERVKYKYAVIKFYRTTLSSRPVTIQFKLNNLMILGLDELTLDQETGASLEWSVQLSVEEVSKESIYAGAVV